MKPYLNYKDVSYLLHVSEKTAYDSIRRLQQKPGNNGIKWCETEEYQFLSKTMNKRYLIPSSIFIRAFPSTASEVKKMGIKKATDT